MNHVVELSRSASFIPAIILFATASIVAQTGTYSLSDSLIASSPTQPGVDLSPDQGTSIAIAKNGNTVLSGAPYWGRTINPARRSTINPGAGLLWTYQSGSWSHQVLNAQQMFENAHVGASVALDTAATTALLGAPNDSSGKGSVVVMIRNDNTWSQQAKLTMPNPSGSFVYCLSQSCRFGSAVALSGDGNTALIGVPNADDSYIDGLSAGKFFVFTRSGTTWSQQTIDMPSNAIGKAYLGSSVALSHDGNTAIIGGLNDDRARGAAWVYTRDNQQAWTQRTKLVGSLDAAGAQFGYSVALSGDGSVAAVGAASSGDSGATYVFGSGDAGVTWTQNARLIATDDLPVPYGAWEPPQGASVSVADGVGSYAIAVGGLNTDTLSTGATWVWEKQTPPQGTNYVSTKLPKGDIPYKRPQGRRVVISGDGSVVLSADGESNSLYVYRRDAQQ